MEQAVDLEAVRTQAAAFGPRCLVVTTSDGGRPHVVSAVPVVGAAGVELRVGSRTRANLAARPRVTLTWAPPDGGEYLFIVDGAAEQVGEPDAGGVSTVRVAVDRAVLHRLAELPGDAPSCIPVGA